MAKEILTIENGLAGTTNRKTMLEITGSEVNIGSDAQTFTNVTATPTNLSLAPTLAKSIRVMSNGANWLQLN